MDQEISAWVRRNRLLRVDKTPDMFAHKKEILLNLYDIAMSGADIPAKPHVYESHQPANPTSQSGISGHLPEIG